MRIAVAYTIAGFDLPYTVILHKLSLELYFIMSFI